MAKRRFQKAPSERSPEELTPEERRVQRKKDRQKGEAKGLGSGWRRAGLVGIPAAVIVAIVLFLLLGHVPTPCLTLQTVPASSGDPAFPDHNTTDFTTTWCPSGTTPAIEMQIVVKISITGTSVTIPNAIGRNSSYHTSSAPYECSLPILTQPPALTGAPAGTVLIISPWPYSYTLGQFFGVWAQSYSTIYVNATSPSQPITYTSSDLLGFSADQSHSITLFVDNQISNAGPSLPIDQYPSSSATLPSCLATVYGSGHTILLTYSHLSAVAIASATPPASLETGPADPGLVGSLYDAPGPHVSFGIATDNMVREIRNMTIPWLLMRAGP